MSVVSDIYSNEPVESDVLAVPSSKKMSCNNKKNLDACFDESSIHTLIVIFNCVCVCNIPSAARVLNLMMRVSGSLCDDSLLV